MISNTFNAQTWMGVILRVFNAEHGPIKGFNPMLVASMKSTQVSQNDFQIYMEKAVMQATKFASMNLEKSEPINHKNQ